MITQENADAECYLGNPAPRGVDSVWHYDLGQIPGGQKCLECGALFLTPEAKEQAKVHFKALKDLGIEVKRRKRYTLNCTRNV